MESIDADYKRAVFQLIEKGVSHESIDTVVNTISDAIAEGMRIDTTDSSGMPLLHKVVHKLDKACSDEDTVKLLKCFVQHNANFNGRDKSGGTVLHVAALDGLDTAIKLLVEQFGVIPEYVNNAGKTASECASDPHKKYLSEIESGIHVAIEKRDVSLFEKQLSVPSVLTRKHPVLGTGPEYLHKLLKDYEDDTSFFKGISALLRNNKLKEMLKLVPVEPTVALLQQVVRDPVYAAEVSATQNDSTVGLLSQNKLI